MSENTKTPETDKAIRDYWTGGFWSYAFAEHARRLERERDALREVLQRYMGAYPAFRMKPIGAEGSPARIEQENLMALEEAAKAAISATEGGGR